MSWEIDLQAAADDPEAAARVLGHVATFIRRGEVLPAALAEHIAGAFEAAAAVEGATGDERAKTLARDLLLVRERGRPKKVSDDQVSHAYMRATFLDDLPEDQQKRAFTAMMKQYYSSETTIDGKWDKQEAESDQRTDESVRAFEQWLATASPEQIEVFNLEGVECPHDFAVYVLEHPRRCIYELWEQFKGQ